MSPESSSATLVLLVGPQASGKSTVAQALSHELRRRGEGVALVELDQIAAMALPTLPSWDTAAHIFGLVADQWARSGLNCVVAEGISSHDEVSTFVAQLPATAVLVTVAVTTTLESALRRVEADPTRGVSRDRTFLSQRYAWWSREVARLDADVRLDTSRVPVEQGVRLVIEAVESARATA